MAYLISYDLKARNREKLGGKQVLLSQYLLESSSGSSTILDAVRRTADADDRILVCQCRNSAAWTTLSLPDATVQSIFGKA